MESLSPLPDWATDKPARVLLDALGPAARFVGGCVRDALTEAAPADLDLGVPYPPAETLARLVAAGIKAVPTGIEHGTITAVAAGKVFEVTSLRRDVETFGRHARVEFGADWRDDAARRDFTINALSLDANGGLHDYFDGRRDLAEGRVRFIGDAAARIREDVLRLLRFFRFHARFAKGAFDADALAACRECAPLLPSLSAERVRGEMFRLLAGPEAPAMLDAMRGLGALAHWLPEADAAAIGQFAALRSLETRAGASPDPIRALACFALDAEGFASRWRLSNAEAARLGRLVRPAQRHDAAADPRTRRRIFYEAGAGAADRALLDGAGFAESARADALYEEAKNWRRPIFPVTGDDLRDIGMVPGPDLGRTLKKLEQDWVFADFGPSKETLLATLGHPKIR
ncbi:MAG: CCA tRNA nucleotidyltransferase [Tagaea sp.]